MYPPDPALNFTRSYLVELICRQFCLILLMLCYGFLSWDWLTTPHGVNVQLSDMALAQGFLRSIWYLPHRAAGQTDKHNLQPLKNAGKIFLLCFTHVGHQLLMTNISCTFHEYILSSQITYTGDYIQAKSTTKWSQHMHNIIHTFTALT